MKIRRYSDLIQLPTFDERFQYLQLKGEVGAATFGFDRYLNQIFYSSQEWKDIRNHVILRDNGCDLADPDYQIHSKILIHHMNPISVEEVLHRDPDILNPEYLITTCQRTHNAIHYGDDSILRADKLVIRKPNDTCPWR